VVTEVSISEQETELFDSDEYKVPFPQADGKEVTDLVLRIGGAIQLSRNDPEQAALVESFQLGQARVLLVTVSVEGKRQSVKQDPFGAELVTHAVNLRIHEVAETE
jgi:hypothetical protein